MYILDLGLDTRAMDLPTTAVPWDRFEAILPEAAEEVSQHLDWKR